MTVHWFMKDDTIGHRIQRARERKVLGRSELAEQAGIVYQSLYMIETGKRTPKPATIRKIAAVLGIDPYELLKGDE